MFQRNWRRWLSSALLAVSSTLAAAAPAAELTTIRIAHNGFSSEMPVYVGKDAGIFTKHGFNVEPIFILGGSTTIQALICKSLDLLMGAATPMLSAAINRALYQVIAGSRNIVCIGTLGSTANPTRAPA